ncbi:hypothetical protein SUGI_0901700 [Cryptomeria japonica]|nr:hypothetical protein SUGI_0901700 [Cryptomeria japonica]
MRQSSVQQGRAFSFTISIILLVSTAMAFHPFLRGSQRAPILFTKDQMEIKHAFVSNVEKKQGTVKEFHNNMEEEWLDLRSQVGHTEKKGP